MDKNKFRYCTVLWIHEYNHSRIFISEKNRHYIRCNNKSIHVQILNEFNYIKKYHRINVYDITDIHKIDDITDNCCKIDDITDNYKIDNYYKNEELGIIKHCTILLIDNDNHSKIFISEKNLYYVDNNLDDGYIYFNDDVNGYAFFGYNYSNYDYYYCDDYDDDHDYYCCDFDNYSNYDYHDDDDYNKLVYH